MRYLTLEDILRLHNEVIEDFGGLHGVRKEERLKSVVEAPKQSVFGQDQYAGEHTKAAVYARNIIGDHPFLDGNKRTGITSASVFLMFNGIELTCNQKELEDFTVSIAEQSLGIEDVSDWFKKNSKLR